MIGTSYVTNFVSGLFKKPQTTDGYGKFVGEYNKGYYGSARPYIAKWISGQALTSQEKSIVVACALADSQNWTKAQKKSLQEALTNIPVKQPAPTQAPVVHKVSASYNEQAKTRTIQTPAQITEQTMKATSKIPIIILVGGIGVMLLSKLLGGKR